MDAFAEYDTLRATAGKHVVVEKPLEVTLAKCDALIAVAAARTSGPLTPAQVKAALPALSEQVRSGRLAASVAAERLLALLEGQIASARGASQ